MSRMVEATVRYIDPTDVVGAINRLAALRLQLAEKEQAVSKARRDLEKCEENTRAGLKNYPDLLAEFEAELTALNTRQEERAARETKIEMLRKQAKH